MTSHTLPQLAVWTRFENLWKTLTPRRDCATPPEDPQQEPRAQREIVLEMLERNPEGFQSELDIQDMARFYRCKY